MTQEEKDKIIETIIDDFDFQKAAVFYRMANGYPQTIDQLEKTARKLLSLALDRTECRDCWWGGNGFFGYDGLCVTWDNKRGLTLCYVLTSSSMGAKEVVNPKRNNVREEKA